MRSYLTHVALGVALLGGAASAHADAKSYHGTRCVVSFGADDISYSTNGITNTSPYSTNWAYIYCPFIRDRVFSSSGIVSVWVEGYNASSKTECWLRSQYEDGSGDMYDEDFASAYGFPVGNFTFGPMSVDTYYGNEGSYDLFCQLYPGDTIYHVYVDETGSD